MRNLAIAILLVSGFSTTAAAQETAAATAERLGSQVAARAVDGDDGVGAGMSTAVVEAPIDDVMEVVLDYGNYAEFMPHFTQSRVLSARGSSAMVYMQASAFHDTITLWANMSLRERPSRGTTKIVEGRMTSGNLETFIARWEVTPIDDGRTLVQFRLLIDPDLPFPSGVVTDENVRNARRVLTAFRGRVSRG